MLGCEAAVFAAAAEAVAISLLRLRGPARADRASEAVSVQKDASSPNGSRVTAQLPRTKSQTGMQEPVKTSPCP